MSEPAALARRVADHQRAAIWTRLLTATLATCMLPFVAVEAQENIECARAVMAQQFGELTCITHSRGATADDYIGLSYTLRSRPIDDGFKETYDYIAGLGVEFVFTENSLRATALFPDGERDALLEEMIMSCEGPSASDSYVVKTQGMGNMNLVKSSLSGQLVFTRSTTTVTPQVKRTQAEFSEDGDSWQFMLAPDVRPGGWRRRVASVEDKACRVAIKTGSERSQRHSAARRS